MAAAMVLAAVGFGLAGAVVAAAMLHEPRPERRPLHAPRPERGPMAEVDRTPPQPAAGDAA